MQHTHNEFLILEGNPLLGIFCKRQRFIPAKFNFAARSVRYTHMPPDFFVFFRAKQTHLAELYYNNSSFFTDGIRTKNLF